MISRLKEILLFWFLFQLILFQLLFAGKYWKRSVPSGVPYFFDEFLAPLLHSESMMYPYHLMLM